MTDFCLKSFDFLRQTSISVSQFAILFYEWPLSFFQLDDFFVLKFFVVNFFTHEIVLELFSVSKGLLMRIFLLNDLVTEK